MAGDAPLGGHAANGQKQPAAQPMPTRGGAEEIAATGDERTAEGETATGTISSVGNGSRPPRSRLGRGTAASTAAANAAKSTCCSSTRSVSPSSLSFASRSWSANRCLIIGSTSESGHRHHARAVAVFRDSFAKSSILLGAAKARLTLRRALPVFFSSARL